MGKLEQGVPFLLRFRVSRVALFSDLSTGEHCPLRIPVLRKKHPEDLAAASPRSKPGRDGALSTVTEEKSSSLSLLVMGHCREYFWKEKR